jgi:hypothetical protein
MKRQAIEVYGFGTRLPTRRDRAARAARLILLAAVAAGVGVTLKVFA